MVNERIELLEKHHMVKHVFTDSFGHEHIVTYPTHIGKDADESKPWPAGEVLLEPFNAEPQLMNIRAMMNQREQLFLSHCLQHPVLQSHPKVLSHPDHPNNKTKPIAEQPNDCGCGA